MNRRDLLKSVAPIAATMMAPLMVRGKEVGKSIAVNPEAKYLVFVNSHMIDAQAIADDPHCPLPAGTPLYPVYVSSHETLEDAIRIFQLKDK